MFDGQIIIPGIRRDVSPSKLTDMYAFFHSGVYIDCNRTSMFQCISQRVEYSINSEADLGVLEISGEFHREPDNTEEVAR